MVDSSLISREIPLTGKLVTNEDPITIGQNFRTLTNMRYTRTNPKGIGGHTKINTTALSTYVKPRSGIHFKKDQPSESHVVVESYNAGLTQSVIYENTTAIPSAGDFSSSVIYTPTANSSPGSFSKAPNGYLAFANGDETCLYGGDESILGGFINYDPSDSFFRDQTEQVSDTISSGSSHVATLLRVTESTDDDVLLLHLENNVTDDSPNTPHTVTNNNVTFTSGAKKFGSYGAVFNGTNASLTIPDNADFDFSGADATWTINTWINVDDLANNHTIFFHSTDANNYFKIFVDTNGSVYVSNFDTGAEVLNSTNGFKTSNGVIAAGTQYHIEVVRNGSDWYIFVDGDLKQNMSDATNVGTESGIIQIGYDGVDYADMSIDEYRISTIARHTSNFEVPIAAYGDRTVTYMYVGSIMPLSGIKFYVSTANTTNATASINYWDGSDWQSVSSLSDGTSTTSKSLAKTGTMTFSSTATTAKVKSIKGVIIYWYRISIPSMDDEVGVYNVKGVVPFQPVRDIWDGIARKTLSFFKYDGKYNDFTGNVREDDYDSGNEATYVNVNGLTSSQYLICGFSKQQSGIRFNILGGSGNTAANTNMSVFYWDGSDWVTVGSIQDGTSEDNKSFAQSGLVTWNSVEKGLEFITEFTGSLKTDESTIITTEPPSLYYYKILFDVTLAGTSSKVYLINVNGVPAQETIDSYNYPLFAMDRLWLFSNEKGNKNSSICSSQGTTNVFNGDDSIRYNWGDEGKIIGAAWLYSQYGASLYSIIVVFKKSETWILVGNTPEEWKQYRISSSIGCVAKNSIKVIELPSEKTQGLNRSSIVVFQGANGIYMTDGRPPMLISGDIGNIFDKRETTKIKAANIDDSFSFVDIENQEYHWCFSITSGVDTEYVLDYSRLQWYTIERPTPLQLGIEVEDVNGVSYTYGLIDTGYMLRLENGNSFDGTAIEQTFQFGDIALHKDSISIETRAEYHELTSVAKSSGTISVTHYGDSSSSGTDIEMDSTKSGYRLIGAVKHNKTKASHYVHSWKFTISTDDETVGFEPLFFVCLYKKSRQKVKDYRS